MRSNKRLSGRDTSYGHPKGIHEDEPPHSNAAIRSMPASVDFYEKLGFSIEQRNDDWRWAMLCFGECRLMVMSQSTFTRAFPDPPFSTFTRMTFLSITSKCGGTGWSSRT